MGGDAGIDLRDAGPAAVAPDRVEYLEQRRAQTQRVLALFRHIDGPAASATPVDVPPEQDRQVESPLRRVLRPAQTHRRLVCGAEHRLDYPLAGGRRRTRQRVPVDELVLDERRGVVELVAEIADDQVHGPGEWERAPRPEHARARGGGLPGQAERGLERIDQRALQVGDTSLDLGGGVGVLAERRRVGFDPAVPQEVRDHRVQLGHRPGGQDDQLGVAARRLLGPRGGVAGAGAVVREHRDDRAVRVRAK